MSSRANPDPRPPSPQAEPGQGRIRADQLLVARGLAPSREQARQAIEEGRVFSGSRRIERPGVRLRADAPLQVRPGPSYVSRGGIKLQHALDRLSVPVAGAVAMDVGASTGGFTDCLLQRGARRVYAVDVGYGQLAWRLRTDPRVVVLERTNIRYLDPERIGEPLDLITVDVSFISVTKFLHRLPRFLKEGAWVVVLVKPQFEAGREQVGRGGVVRDDAVRARVLRSVIEAAASCGLGLRGLTASPVLGPSGNAEFFAAFVKGPAVLTQGVAGSVDEVLREAPDRHPREVDPPRLHPAT